MDCGCAVSVMVAKTKGSGAGARRPTVVGMGLVALDVVIAEPGDREPRFFCGGTCGNVVTILSFLGWAASAVARLRRGTTTDRVIGDLEKFGVSTEFISRGWDGSTPVIIHRIRCSREGEAYHTFSWRCPSCGARLPGYRAVLGSVAIRVAGDIGDRDVLFFDRASRGALTVARALRERGAVIVFEPASVGEPRLFYEAWSLAHIVKYSHERLREIADLEFAQGERDGVLVEIETLGGGGARYRSRLPLARTRGWVTMRAFRQLTVRDAAGAGDWFTAGLLDRLAQGGLQELRSTTGRRLKEAVRYGQALAAWNCRFEGARGGMYERTRAEFAEEVEEIRSGEVLAAPGNRANRKTSGGSQTYARLALVRGARVGRADGRSGERRERSQER